MSYGATAHFFAKRVDQHCTTGGISSARSVRLFAAVDSFIEPRIISCGSSAPKRFRASCAVGYPKAGLGPKRLVMLLHLLGALTMCPPVASRHDVIFQSDKV